MLKIEGHKRTVGPESEIAALTPKKYVVGPLRIKPTRSAASSRQRAFSRPDTKTPIPATIPAGAPTSRRRRRWRIQRPFSARYRRPRFCWTRCPFLCRFVGASCFVCFQSLHVCCCWAWDGFRVGVVVSCVGLNLGVDLICELCDQIGGVLLLVCYG